MSNKISKYIDESLAATGFVILTSAAAYRLRSDLWTSGPECGSDFAGKNWQHHVGYLQGIKRFHARIEGMPGLTDVIARSADHLVTRIRWITGLEVTALFAEEDIAGQPAPSDVPRKPVALSGDLHAGTQTAQGPRSCSVCENFTAGHACTKPKESGIERPNSREPRRCLAFEPLWDSGDNRTGVQLWPELQDLEKTSHGA